MVHVDWFAVTVRGGTRAAALDGRCRGTVMGHNPGEAAEAIPGTLFPQFGIDHAAPGVDRICVHGDGDDGNPVGT